MPLLIKKIIADRQITGGYEHFEYVYNSKFHINSPNGLHGDLLVPEKVQKYNQVLAKKGQLRSPTHQIIETPLFNKKGVFTHRVEIGPLGIYYLFLKKGYCFAPGLKISQKEVYPNIYFSNPKDPYLLYTFYNNGSAQDILFTGRVIKDEEKIADHIMENPEDFYFAQDLIEQMNLKYELNLIRGIDSFDTILFDFEHRDNRKTSFRLVNSKTKNKSETVWLTAVQMTFLVFLALERKAGSHHWMINPSEHPNDLKLVASIMKNVISKKLKDELELNNPQKGWINGHIDYYRKVVQRIHKDLAKYASIHKKPGERSGPLIYIHPEPKSNMTAQQLAPPIKYIKYVK